MRQDDFTSLESCDLSWLNTGLVKLGLGLDSNVTIQPVRVTNQITDGLGL